MRTLAAGDVLVDAVPHWIGTLVKMLAPEVERAARCDPVPGVPYTVSSLNQNMRVLRRSYPAEDIVQS